MLKISQKIRQTSSTLKMDGMAPTRAFTTTCQKTGGRTDRLTDRQTDREISNGQVDRDTGKQTDIEDIMD